MLDQKNLLLAIVLSLAILLGFNVLWPTAPAPQPAQNPAPTEQAAATAPQGAPAGTGPEVSGAQPVEAAEALARAPRVKIETPALSGSLSLIGGRIDDLSLNAYRETTDPESAKIVLLTPKGTTKPYYAEFGWVASDPATPVPGSETPWTADSDLLTPEKPVTLTWDNGAGLTFVRTISVDPRFMFTITDTVENKGETPVTLFPYGLISRGYTPQTAGTYVLHEGPVGVLDGTLKEVKYKDLQEKKEISLPSTGGWIGITDKYWLTAIDLGKESESKARFLYRGQNGDRYQADYLGTSKVVAPGTTAANKTDFFAGAKEVNLLDQYSETYGIDRFDLAVDFGWFYFLTKPFFFGLQALHGWLGNFGLAIIAFTVCLRLAMFPLANKSFKSMSRMKALQPKIKELQESFGDDKMKLNQAMMALYKEHKVSPVSGCLPMLIQIPIFFSLYKVLYVSLEMRHAPFYGWIHDLSAADPTTIANLFGLIPWDPPSFLHLGVWPLIMGVTMWIQQKLNPAPADPTQAKVMMMLPIVFTVMLASFPAGLVIYWACNNTLSVAQQWIITKRVAAADAAARQKHR